MGNILKGQYKEYIVRSATSRVINGISTTGSGVVDLPVGCQCITQSAVRIKPNHNSLSARILHRAPPRLQVEQNFLTQKIVADPKMRCHQKSFGIWRVGHRGHFRSKTCFFSKNIFWKKFIINHTIFLNFRYALFRY